MPTNWADKAEVAEYMRNYYRAHNSWRRPIVAGADRQEKLCRGCGEVKSRADYTVRGDGPRKGHLAGYCKACSSKQSGNHYRAKHERDPDLYRRIEWPSKLKRLYGITVEDYHRMLEAQGGGCALCGTKTPLAGNREYKRRKREVFDVDHCHTTGRVRGLLCTRCNRLVGLAGDSAETAQKLVNYLKQE